MFFVNFLINLLFYIAYSARTFKIKYCSASQFVEVLIGNSYVDKEKEFMSSKLLRGTFILTLGTMISKVLGLFYVIPFDAIVGQEGTTLYQYSYVPYTIFLSIATAGVPLAISKFISKYNALEEYAVGRKLFKSGLLIMVTTGIVSFLILYFSAPLLANMIIRDTDQVTSAEDVIKVIRAVSFALIVVPFMSLNRGFFQGHQSMGPTA